MFSFCFSSQEFSSTPSLLGEGGERLPFIKKISLTATTTLAKGQHSIVKKAKNSKLPTVFRR